ncbi:FimB/Mfa2 family fimbrial subunit [Parabacteroides bouchesdurhonensis]|uniref:FimB/Mfa2 family fimbrial subunit n=1 Tax=Parabacteroides bouchesdurhonensis TaxID=1936995 RepID=UPI000C831ED0|nr:FISUMP domain-containing protein [Parabacteroides bouchesdurhonensis]
MKKKLIALAMLVAGLTSCNDEVVIKENPGYAEPGTAVVNLNMNTVKNLKSYADDKKTLAANADEQQIESIAFFVKVGTNTSLQCYRSTEMLGSTDGFTQKLTEVEAGKYTATFKMAMTGTNNVQFFALANYAENNIQPETITNEDLLKAAVSEALTAENPVKPLLMFGSAEVNNLNEGEAKDVEFNMDRLVARVDIINNAYNADASKGFRITSAKVLNGKEQAALMPNSYTLINNINVIADALKESKAVTFRKADGTATTEGVDVVYQRLDTLYMYENLNGVEFDTDGSVKTAPSSPVSDATAIQIDGTFNGSPMSQRVEFMTKGQAAGDTAALSIMRNSLYTIKIIPSQDTTSISFNVTVADWSSAEGDTMTIKPTLMKPELTAITATDLGGVSKTSDKVYTITDPTTLAGTLTFTASGNHDSKVEVQYFGRKNAAWLPADAVVKGELQGYYSAHLSRDYTIDFSKADKTDFEGDKAKVPSDAWVIIQNASEITMADTIFIQFRPNYEGTTIKPVLYKGQFWAPVNVGATQVPTSVSTTWSRNTCGYLYQWGRNVPFSYDATNSNTDLVDYPDKTYAEIIANASGIYTNKFVKGDSNADYIWFNDYATTSMTEWPRENQPCPAGWRVPTKEEFDKIAAEKPLTSNGIWKSKENPLFVLPASGYRGGSGNYYNVSIYGLYWSSDLVKGKSPCLNFNTDRVQTTSDSTGSACAIRCVQE